MKVKSLLVAALLAVVGISSAQAQSSLSTTVRQYFTHGQVIPVRQLLNINQEYAKAQLLTLSLTGQATRPGVVLDLMINGQVLARAQAPTNMQVLTFRFQNTSLAGGKSLQVGVRGGEYYLDNIEARFSSVMQPGPNPPGPIPGPYPPTYPNPNPGPFPPNPYPPYPQPQPNVIRVTCSSFAPLSASCPAGGYIRTAQLVAQHSNDACVYGKSWWFDATNIIVTRGCRATFNVWLR